MGRYVASAGKNCVACGTCVKLCPIGAISIYKGLRAKVDITKCAGCGRCEKNCPAGVMELLARDPVPVG